MNENQGICSHIRKKAANAFTKATHLSPGDATTHFQIGKGCFHMRCYEEAIQSFEEAIRIDPNFIEALGELSKAYILGGHRQKSVDYFTEVIKKSKEAISIQPDNFQAYVRLGIGYEYFAGHEKAGNALKEALRIDPDNAYVHFYLGQVFVQQADKKAAQDKYRKLQTLNRGYAEFLAGSISTIGTEQDFTISPLCDDCVDNL